MVWAQLSFPQAPEQGQRQLGPKLSLKHREGCETAGLQQQSVAAPINYTVEKASLNLKAF